MMWRYEGMRENDWQGMNEWLINEWTNEWNKEWKSERRNEETNERPNEWMTVNEWMTSNERMNWLMDGWKNPKSTSTKMQNTLLAIHEQLPYV